MTTEFENKSVGEIVREDYRTSKVFKSHHIDFCCGGGKSLTQVCSERQMDEQKLVEELLSVTNSSTDSSTIAFDTWPIDLLADYIEKTHHRYVESAIPPLKQYLKKLAAVHGSAGPYLIEIKELFNQSAGNLDKHMKKEELLLFPYIRKMVRAKKEGMELDSPVFGSVLNPVQAMIEEHESEGEHFRLIEQLSNDFEIPEWGCNTYAVAMQLLQEFQNDLHLHIHLENNILFPKAVSLDESLRKEKAH